MSSTARPRTTTAFETGRDPRMAVAYVVLELVVVPLGVLLLALTFIPGDTGLAAPNTPPANAKALRLPGVSEPGALLLVERGHRSGPRGPAVR